MSTFTVELGPRSYPVHVIEELPGRLAAQEALRLHPRPGPVLIVTDTKVRKLYAAGVRDALGDAGFKPEVVELRPGERSKTLATVSRVVDRALAAKVGRGDLLVALGGGVVGDIAGFAASILHRGVDFIQVPTTLLAAVDSSVGGKTGVNHATGKNLIGAFWQPRAVVASRTVLETLPEREVRCGLAEAFKHAALADRDLVDWMDEQAAALRGLASGPTRELIERCVQVKAEIVSADEREEGDRALLNLGHTFGHAYERLAGYGVMTHGEAVALGMVLAARISEAQGVASFAGLARDLAERLEALGLPANPEAAGLPRRAALLEAARSDKKARGDRVRFVLLASLGRALLRTLEWSQINDALAASEGS